MNRKLMSFTVDVTIIKVVAWASALWMFLSLILSVTDAVQINDFSFGNEGHGRSSGDYGIIIILTTFLIFIIPLFIKGKLDKLFGGIFLFVLGLIAFIGTLVTSASAATFLGWSIPTISVATIGVLWILDGSGVVNFKDIHSKKSRAFSKKSDSNGMLHRPDEDLPEL